MAVVNEVAISAEKKLKQELRRLRALTVLLRRCNHALLHATDEAYLLTEVCTVLVSLGGYRFAWVGFFQEDEIEPIRIVASWGNDDGYLDLLRTAWKVCGDEADTAAMMAIRDKKPYRLRQLGRAGNAKNFWYVAAKERGFGSALGLPLIFEDGIKPMGVITLYSGSDEGFSEEEIELLEEVVKDVSKGIEHLHQRVVRSRMEEALRAAEASYEGLLENTGTGTIVIENDSIIRFCNATFEKMTGYPREEIIGYRKWSDFMAPEDVKRMENYHIWRREQPGRAPSVYECKMVDKSGNIKDLLMKVGMVEGSNISVASCMDISDAKKAKNLLHEREAQLSAIVNELPGMIFIRDINGHLLFGNRQLIKALGYNPESEYCYKAFFNRDTPCTDCPAEHAFAGQTARKEFFLQKQGRWYEAFFTPITAYDGSIGRIQVIFTDISDRKAAESALVLREEHLRKENKRLRSAMQERRTFGGLVGKSQVMQEVYDRILKAASNASSVIIYGESGTGKELTARAIHDMSDRVRGPFVPVNCGAISENLVESAFFGHKKGSFTGADRDHQGYLSAADGGTIFLDEIGEIPLSMQVKLLRALDGAGFTPVGGTAILKPNIRVIAATNRNLYDLLRENRMREDFFYRIHILPIRLPPLRERKEDLPLLIEHFFKIYGAGRVLPPVTGKLLESFSSHDWPGNVRELQNAIQRYLSLERLDFLGEREEEFSTEPVNGEEDVLLVPRMDSFEKKLILEALHKCQWHREKAAERLGIHRKTLFTKMKKYGLLTDFNSMEDGGKS